MSEVISLADSTSVRNPLDVIERVIEFNEWEYERQNDTKMTVQVTGYWCDYHLSFTWDEVMEELYFSCTFDTRVPDNKKLQIYELLAKANNHLWLGHFSVWGDESLPMFNHTLQFRGTHGPTIQQIVDLTNAAIHAFEWFYPAFQYIIWNNTTVDKALTYSMIETVGEA